MSRLKDKVIKYLGGFTNAEMEENKEENLHRKPYVVHKQLSTVKLRSERYIPAWEYVPEEHLRHILAEGLEREIAKHMRITCCDNPDMTTIYRAEIEVVVREGGAE
jgi:hypothetical protein